MLESRRAAVRIASNYGRLFASVTLGLYLVSIQMLALGEYGFGLVALLGSTTGFAAIVEQVTGWSMIRELGAAHHSGDRRHFRVMFNSAMVVCIAATIVTLTVFAVIVLSLEWMNIAPEMLPAARWFVIAKACETAVLVLLTPQFNLYLVLERMLAYNFWLTCRRASLVVAALSLFWLSRKGDAAGALIIYGWLSSALFALTIIVPAALITLRDRALVPDLQLASREGIRAIVRITGWNLLMQGATTLALPAGAIIMNIAFGVGFGNLIFGVAVRLAAYTRMLASGMTAGLDAVAARISVTALDDKSMRHLVRHSTLLHGLVVFPFVIGVSMLAKPILLVWIGRSMHDPESSLPAMVTLLRILLVGFTGVAMFDCWTRILYGAGHVREYAPLVIVTNVIVLGLSLALLALLPERLRFAAVAIAYSGVYVASYSTILPLRVAHAVGERAREVYRPLLRPLIAALVCTPILQYFLQTTPEWHLRQLFQAILAYGSAYVLLSWFLIIPPNDRERITRVTLGLLRTAKA